jgi:glucan 1,3-beta-glucosidase
MAPFWKSAWMKSKISLSDDQRDQLLPNKSQESNLNQPTADETPSQPTASKERYVGFGIGGAGNIRKYDWSSSRFHGVGSDFGDRVKTRGKTRS